jgi:hypothetical protein
MVVEVSAVRRATRLLVRLVRLVRLKEVYQTDASDSIMALRIEQSRAPGASKAELPEGGFHCSNL